MAKSVFKGVVIPHMGFIVLSLDIFIGLGFLDLCLHNILGVFFVFYSPSVLVIWPMCD